MLGGLLLTSCNPENIDDTTLIPLTVDCPNVAAGDACTTDDGLGGIVSFINGGEDCECVPFDCQELQGNGGDECTSPAGNPGLITISADGSCTCEEVLDCTNLTDGEPCSTNDGLDGYISFFDGSGDCGCVPFDCQEFQGTAGGDCTSPAGNPGLIIILADGTCECDELPIYDCPSLNLNIGEFCFTTSGNVGEVDANCNCEELAVDCPNWGLNIGDTCETDGPSGTVAGTINANCDCET